MSKREHPPTVALPLEEGVAEGGKVLWTETDKEFSKRRSGRKLGLSIAGGGFLSLPVFFLVVLGIGIAQPAAQNQPLLVVLFAAMALLLIAFPSWVGYTLIREARDVFPTLMPRVLFEHGITMGEGARPYYPFKAVIWVEEERGARFKTPFVSIAFQGGEFLRISKAPFYEAIEVEDFDAVRRALAGLTPIARDVSIRWDDEAAACVEAMKALRVAARSLFERLAREQGAATIDRAFIEANWKQAQAAYPFEDVPTWREFNRQAKIAQRGGVGR